MYVRFKVNVYPRDIESSAYFSFGIADDGNHYKCEHKCIEETRRALFGSLLMVLAVGRCNVLGSSEAIRKCGGVIIRQPPRHDCSTIAN